MITMQIVFSCANIGRGKGKKRIFHFIFFNKDISITVRDIHYEGSMFFCIYALVFVMCDLESYVP